MPEEVKDEIVEEVIPEGKPDHGALIAESKKYRERAQKAEAALEQREAKEKAAREALLAEQGEYKTLLEQKEAELESANAKAAEWDNYQTTRKEKILEGWTEAQVADFGDLGLSKLEALDRQFKTEPGGKAPIDRPGHAKTGLIYNGYPDLPTWAAKDKESFRKRSGDYPGA